MAEIVVSEFMDEVVVAGASEARQVRYEPDLVDRRPDLLSAVADARALIVRNRTRVDAELLDAAPRLVVVGRLGVGLDNIDLDACEERGVAVKPAVGANAAAVAEYVIGAILVLRRGVFGATREVAGGAWPRQTLQGREVGGMTLGLVGFGSIAREVAIRARALGMAVTAHDPLLAPDDPAWSLADRRDLDALVAGSDALSVHVPLTEDTRHLIDAGLLASLPDGAIVVNTSRGGVVDEDALAAALRSGRLGGAALDVFETEPLTVAAGRRFAGLDSLILTPHVAGLTEESNVRVSEVTMRSVLEALGQAGDGSDGR